MGGQAGNSRSGAGMGASAGGMGNPAAPYAGLPQAGMQANRDSMQRRFGGGMRPPGGGMVGGGGTQGPGGIAGPNDMATAGGTPGFDMRGPPGARPPGFMGQRPPGMQPGDPNDQTIGGTTMPVGPPGGVPWSPPGGEMPGMPPGMGNARVYRPGMGNPGGSPDFGALAQAMGSPKPMMPGGTGVPQGPGGLQSTPAPNQWNTTGRDQAMALLGSRSGRSPYRPPGG